MLTVYLDQRFMHNFIYLYPLVSFDPPTQSDVCTFALYIRTYKTARIVAILLPGDLHIDEINKYPEGVASCQQQSLQM